MLQNAVEGVPQRGTLLRRAHELLEGIGRPTAESLLIQHLFGVAEDTHASTNRSAIWTLLLRQALNSSSLFEQTADHEWSLSAWRSTHLLLDEVDFVVLDTETTGLRPGPDRVIEVAAIRLRGGEVVDSFQSLVNPHRRLPPFIVQFTGITQEMVSSAPAGEQVFPDFLRFIEGAILVGHNVGFDIGFLSHEAHLLGQVFPIDGIDTILFARRYLPALRRFKLDLVANHLKIPAANRHRAMGDARVTAAKI